MSSNQKNGPIRVFVTPPISKTAIQEWLSFDAESQNYVQETNKKLQNLIKDIDTLNKRINNLLNSQKE